MNEKEYDAARGSVSKGFHHVIKTVIVDGGRKKESFYLSHCGRRVSSRLWLFQDADHARNVKRDAYLKPCPECWDDITEKP